MPPPQPDEFLSAVLGGAVILLAAVLMGGWAWALSRLVRGRPLLSEFPILPLRPARWGGGTVAAVILEPSALGKVKTMRKGTGFYQLAVTGRAAHAGLEPEKGANALIALAELIGCDAPRPRRRDVEPCGRQHAPHHAEEHHRAATRSPSRRRTSRTGTPHQSPLGTPAS